MTRNLRNNNNNTNIVLTSLYTILVYNIYMYIHIIGTLCTQHGISVHHNLYTLCCVIHQLCCCRRDDTSYCTHATCKKCIIYKKRARTGCAGSVRPIHSEGIEGFSVFFFFLFFDTRGLHRRSMILVKQVFFVLYTVSCVVRFVIDHNA